MASLFTSNSTSGAKSPIQASIFQNEVGDIPLQKDPWEKSFSTVKRYDDDLCSGWREEVDKLLIFAGLFSATVTAFLVESHSRLFEDPADKTNWLLEQVLIQVYNANIVNSSDASPLPIRPQFSPEAIDVRLNVFWFLSLTLSLTAVVLAILCIQWLREYQRIAPADPKDALSLRQIRVEGMTAWRVPDVLASLPVLLHLSLILFFAGLIDLLWDINHTVAAFITTVSAIALIAIAVTTLLPGLQLLFMAKTSAFSPQCPYKSPQAWVFRQLLTFVVRLINQPRRIVPTSYRTWRCSTYFLDDEDWVSHDISWRKMRKDARKNQMGNGQQSTDAGKALAWIAKHLGKSIEVTSTVYRCMMTLRVSDGLKVLVLLNDQLHNHRIQELLTGSQITEASRKKLVSLLFLERETHFLPQLDNRYFRDLVTFLSTWMTETGIQYKSTNGVAASRSQDKIAPAPFINLVRLSLQEQPYNLVLEYLQCLNKLAPLGVLRSPEFQKDVWDLIHGVLFRVCGKDGSTVSEDDLVIEACKLVRSLVSDILAVSASVQMKAAQDIEEQIGRCAEAAEGVMTALADIKDHALLKAHISAVVTLIDKKMKELLKEGHRDAGVLENLLSVWANYRDRWADVVSMQKKTGKERST